VSYSPRLADDHRDPVGLVEVADLAQQVMVAQLLAVIAGEDDQRVVPLAGSLEMVEHPA
jgi:hypothetical protein